MAKVTVRELIAHLQALPQDMPVRAMTAVECDYWLDLDDVHVETRRFWDEDLCTFSEEHRVDIN